MRRTARFAVLLLALLPATSAWGKGRSSEVLVGQTVQIGEGETRDQDLICIGCHVLVDGSLDGDVVLVGGQLAVNGTVTGDTAIIGGHATLGEHAHLGGDVADIGGHLVRAPGATVTGDITATRSGPFGVGFGLMVGLGLGLGLSAALLGLLAVLLAFAVMGDRRTQAISDTIQHHAPLALLTGAAVCLIWIFLAHSPRILRPVAFPLHFAVGFALLLALVAGYTGLSLMLGRRISARSSMLGMTMIGALVIAIIQIIPIIGWIMFVFFVWMALGGCILALLA